MRVRGRRSLSLFTIYSVNNRAYEHERAVGVGMIIGAT
jgi:hypothetical protein